MEAIRANLSSKLQGIERYNPENIKILESYIEAQVRENGYDLEANLALLKLYQFNPPLFNANAVFRILVSTFQRSNCKFFPYLSQPFTLKLFHIVGQGTNKPAAH